MISKNHSWNADAMNKDSFATHKVQRSSGTIFYDRARQHPKHKVNHCPINSISVVMIFTVSSAQIVIVNLSEEHRNMFTDILALLAIVITTSKNNNFERGILARNFLIFRGHAVIPRPSARIFIIARRNQLPKLHTQTRPSVWQLRKLSGGLTRFPLDEEKNGLINICPSKKHRKIPREIGTKNAENVNNNSRVQQRNVKKTNEGAKKARNLSCIAEKNGPLLLSRRRRPLCYFSLPFIYRHFLF